MHVFQAGADRAGGQAAAGSARDQAGARPDARPGGEGRQPGDNLIDSLFRPKLILRNFFTEI
jgi:hypothetical protein